MSLNNELDQIDRKILQELAVDARVPFAELGSQNRLVSFRRRRARPSIGES